MRANEMIADARRAGLAWAIGVLDARACFRVVSRRRLLVDDTPVDLLVYVTCDEDVGMALEGALGGIWVGAMRMWKLRAFEMADVLELVIPLMRCARRVLAAQAVLACKMTKGRVGQQVSDAVRAARREARAAGSVNL